MMLVQHIVVLVTVSVKMLSRHLPRPFMRSVKYEDIYIKGYATIEEAREGLTKYFEHYNAKRFHQSLDNKKPDHVYTEIITKKPAQSRGDLYTGSV